MKAKVAGVAAPKEFTSFMRIEFDRAREDGTLAKLQLLEPTTLTPKQDGMLAFHQNNGVKVPGGIENVVSVRVFKRETATGAERFDFICSLKKSAAAIHDEEYKAKYAETMALAAAKEREANQAILVEASKILHEPLEKLVKMNFDKVRQQVSAVLKKKEDAKKKVNDFQKKASEPKIVHKPAELTGRKIDLSRIKPGSTFQRQR